MKNAILIIIICLLLMILLLSGWKAYTIWQEYQKGEQTYEDLDQYISVPEKTEPADPEKTEPTKPGAPEQETQPTEPEEFWPQVDFEKLQQLNPDVVGWIYIEGTQVNYPIVQGKDNDYYLYRLFTGERNSSGSIFLEAGLPRDFTAQNNPVYGHHMKNGTMFADVINYKKQEFYETHPVALLMTPEKNYELVLFSGYVVKPTDDSWDTSFSEEAFGQWLQKVKNRSLFISDVVPTVQDRIVTLSTCTYETDDARFVVHGILREAS